MGNIIYSPKYLLHLANKKLADIVLVCVVIVLSTISVDASSSLSTIGSKKASAISTQEPVAACTPVSILNCTELQASLPLNLQFNGLEGGLSNSGFTMALPHSAPRLAIDGPVTYANVNGYESSKLSFKDGKLAMQSSKGIMFRDPGVSVNTNTQVNALGVATVARQKLRISTTLANPFASIIASDFGSQQAGIWHGVDDNNYVKLALVKVNGTSTQVKVQLMVESYGRATTSTVLPIELNSVNFNSATNQAITLTLDIDPLTGLANGSYQINNGSKTYLSTSGLAVPAFILDGTDHDNNIATENASYTGLYATHRNSNNPVEFQFDNFSIVDFSEPVAIPFRLNAAGPQRIVSSNVFVADEYYAPLPGEFSNTVYPDLASTTTPELYYDRRFGANMSYNIPIANGSYKVRLHMVENFHTIAGARVFDVEMEGITVIDNIDLFVEGNSQRGQIIIKEINSTVADGRLDIKFLASADKAIINAIEILPAVTANQAPVFEKTAYTFNVQETLPVNSAVGDVSATDKDGDEVNYEITAGNDAGKFTVSATGSIIVAAALVPAQYVLTVSASDGKAETSAGVTINVARATSENNAPIANPDAASGYYGTPVQIDVLSNDTDTDGTLIAASIIITRQPAKGTVAVDAGKIVYTPAALGTFTFAYTVADDRAAVSEPAMVTVTTGVKINYQDLASTTPAGYLKDYGQGFGARTESGQGEGFSYGWKDLSGLNDGALDLTRNGRNRLSSAAYASAAPDAQLRATLLHMQANHIAGFNGNPTEGKWEMQVPNGRYKVTVGVGDPNVDASAADIPKHSINVEGVAAIINFVPAGTTFDNSGQRHHSYAVVVDVTDEMLTVDAFGGHNTKINSVIITPTVEAAAGTLTFEPNQLLFEAPSGGTAVKKTVLLKANPATTASAPKLFANAPAWLTIPNPSFGELEFAANPGALPAGDYSTEVIARAVGYTSAALPVAFNLSDPQSSEAAFTSFSIQDAVGAINSTEHTISLLVPSTTNLTGLVATFSTSVGATAKVGEVLQVSGETANDFTNPVTYKITAQDGVTIQNWVVTVTKTNNQVSLGVTPATLNFAKQVVGTTSQPQDITVTNQGETGTSTILLGQATTTDESFIVGVPVSNTLSPGESTTIPVTFAPKSAGVKSANLAITHSGQNSPVEVSLSGTAAVACSPISTLPCEELTISLPFNLNFTGTEGKLANTGFTMADAYTGSRNTADGTASSTTIGFEPSKLTVENGTLKVLSNKGIAFLTNNNQINSLGIKFDASKKFMLETTLVKPFYGTQSQQAGLWVGLNDKTFVKLVVTGNKVELRREKDDVSSTVSVNNPDQRITPEIIGLDNQTVRLRLIIDPVANTAEGFYSTDGVTYSNAGESYATKSVSIADMGIAINGAFAGIQATHRNATTPVTYTFDNFSITPIQAPVNQAPVIAVAPQNQNLTAGAIFSFSAGSYTDPDEDALVYTATLADASALPAWLTFNATDLLFSGTAPATAANLTVKVVATDTKGESVSSSFTIVVNEAAPIVGCSPISTLPCPELRVSLNNPFVLDFSSNAGGLADKAGVGTGFKMVDNPSARLAADDPVYSATVPGYEPSKLEITGGQLKITTNRGIAYLKPTGTGTTSPRTNSQINTLGVGLNAATQKFNIETTIINPYVGTKAEQAGLWFGLDEDNYVKLVVNNGTIELRREIGAVSGSTAADVVNSGTSPITNISSSSVKLRLFIDNVAGTVSGFYSINGGAEIQVGGTTATMSIPTLIAGKTVGELTGLSFAGIFATHRNAGDPDFGTLANPPVYTFDNFEVEAVSPVVSALSFNPSSLSFAATQGTTVAGKTATLTASEGTPEISLTKSANSDWLVLPANGLGALTFNINTTGLAAGNYTSTITAASAGYTSASLTINLVISAPVASQEIKVNFQDPATVPPTGWVRDYGQAFGLKTGQNQGSGLTYGWKKRSDSSLLDLSVGGTTPGNGRNRGVPSDVLLATLMHMQGNHVSGTFNGTPVEGYWEVKVPNGVYDVTVSTGDGQVNSDPEIHTINVEGINAISGFIPSGTAGSLTRFKSAKVRVTVADEHLTINADGGTNTKINSALIVPLSTDPYLYWSANAQNLVIEKDPAITNKTFSLDLSKSGGSEAIPITLSATYGSGASGWLVFNSTHNSNEPNVTFDYTAAKELATGTYTATVTASADGYTSANFAVQVTVAAPGSTRPYVISSTPANGETGVSLNPTIAANSLYVPEIPGIKGGVDNSTITSETVKLLKISSGSTTTILGTVQGTGGGDAISFSPTFALEPNTTYKFVITDGVKSYSGAQFIPYEATFTTGAVSTDPTGPIAVEFKPEAIPGTQGKKYTSVTFGPDGKFYALRLDGTIERFTVNRTTGQLSNMQEIRTIVNKYGNRSAVGLTFDPSSTASNLVAWVSHCSAGLDNAPEFDGNLSKVTGSNLETEQLVLTRLPRSKKDHLVNSIAFGPDGALYFNQGSNSAMGAYDGTWQRNESLLAGAVLRLDLNKLNGISLPLNVQTTANQAFINAAPANSITMSDGTYNPYASNSPLTIYASGVRNAYDLVWHSNGHLYVPANGSAAGGASPASVAGTRRPNGSLYDGPAIPATTSIQVQRDWLFRVNPNKPVGYYGHANPLRGEYVTNRGYIDNNKYTSTTVADANYRGAAFDFEFNKSPNGVLEYKSNAFNGALKGWILVCRFSGGSDIIALKPGTMSSTSDQVNDGVYNIVEARTGSGTNGIPGFGGLSNPLDITEDIETGNVYVIEYNWNNTAGKATQITLLKATTPSAPAAVVSVSPEQVLDNVVAGNTGPNRTVTVANKGNATLSVSGISLEGVNADQFLLSGVAALPITVAPNSATTFNVAFKPTTTGVKAGSIKVSSNGGDNKLVKLGGLGTAGLGGSNEPSLQAILDVYGVKVNVGDDNAATNIIHSSTDQQKAALLGDEITLQKFERAVDGPVTVEPLAVFGPQHSGGIVTAFGWYASGDANAKNELFTVANSDYQTIRVNATGALSFDPGTSSFGFYSRWPFFENRHLYSEDALNTFSGAIPHHVRVYALKNADGTLVENAYVVATEEHISGFDYQDIVVIVRNVRPAGQVVVATGNRINAGGPDYVDGQSKSWSADAYFSASATSSKTFDVQGTTDDPLYLTYRYATPATNTANPGAPFSYNIPVESGEYNVKLHFLEPYFGAPGGVTGTAGSRVFHVDIEGQRVLNNYDMFATDGAATAIVKTFNNVIVTDGKLDINFTSIVNNAIVSAIEFENIAANPPSEPLLTISPAELIFDGVKSTTIGPKVVTLKNDGGTELAIESITKTGANQSAFTITGAPTSIAAGQSAAVNVTFQPGATVGVMEAALQISSNDPANPTKVVPLSGLSINGFEGGNEPTLANVVKALGYTTNVGWSTLSSGMDSYAKGDEVLVPLFEKAGTGNVKITPVARYSPAEELPFGWYINTTGNVTLNQVGALLGGSPHHQTLFPGLASGGNTFDPQTAVFGIYVDSRTFGRKTYTEDDLNAITGSGFNHRVRTYTVKGRDGNLIPNNYLVCFEDAENGDYQDYVFLVSNAVPVGARPALAFNPNSLNFTVTEGGTAPAKHITLSANNGTPNAVTLTKSANSNWLILPNGSLGELAFAIDASGVLPGNYQATVTAAAEGFVSTTLEISLEVTSFSVNAIKVNFQLPTSATPNGYVADTGLPFDETRGFGWIDPGTKQPKDHTLSMRERTGAEDLRLRTLALMQATNNGQTFGNWEYVLPNGLYNVSVSVGDPDFFDSNHSINVEGVSAISGFVPTTQQKYKAATITVEVKDGKLTIDANGGTNSKINYAIIDPATSEGDRVAPVAAVKLKGTLQSPGVYRGEVVASVEASDAGGAGLAAVYYSLNDGPFVEYYAPFQIKEAGAHTIRAKAVDGNNNETITNTYSFSIVTPVLSNANMVVENQDKFPAADHLTFSNIQIPWQRTGTPFNENHNKVKLRISNKGTGVLSISNLAFSNATAWKIAQLNGVDYNAASALPVNVNPGAFVDATIEFIARDQATRVKVLHDTLYISSNDDQVPYKKVQLHGLWQKQGEGSNEPFAQEIINAFGFKTRTGFNSNDGTADGNTVVPNSDEILSSFFLRADVSKPVYVIQMGAYHGCCASTETFQWYAKGSTSNTTVFTHNSLDGQTLLPRKSGSTTALADGVFTPSVTTANPTAAFGFKVSSAYSDRTRNSEGKIGLRIWKAIDANGNIIPNAYIVGHDYIGSDVTNYDYQDNVFFISNVKPEVGPANFSELAAAPSAINLGSAKVGSTKPMSVTLTNLGKTYPDGSSDPAIQIKSVEITGPNLSDFVASMPATTVLAPQGSASVTVNFRPTGRGIKNAALLVHYNNSLSPLRIPLYGIADDDCSTIAATKRIKSAADANITVAGNVWESDKNYRKGNVQLDKPAATPIAGTDDDVLYQTYLSSTGDLNEIRYEIPVANGNYMVRMHFVENFWTAVGARVFNISLENELRLSNFDIYREVGYKTALVKDFDVNVADGVLNIKFNPSANRLAIAGLEIFGATSTQGALALSSKTITGAACGASDGAVELQVANTSGAAILYKQGANGTYQSSAVFGGLAAGTYTFYAKENVANGCESSAVIAVPNRDNNLNFEVAAPALACSASSGTATVSNVTGGSGNYSYAWNTTPVQTGSTATNLSPGVYSVTVTDTGTGCSKSMDVSVDRQQGCVITAVRINAGGTAYKAVNGDEFVADQHFTANNSIVYSNTAIPDIAGTEDDTMYKTERSANADLGSFAYNIPVSNGSHTVKLHFAEIYSTSTSDIGRRVMNVKMEGQTVLSNYDIIADVGVRTAVVKSFEVTVSDGVLNLEFGATANRPKVSAIEVITASDPANQVPVANAGGNKEVILPQASVTLSGTGSDAEDGSKVTFAWSQVSGPNNATIVSANTASTEVNNLVIGSYTFRLTVTDTKGASATSDAIVLVKSSSATSPAIRINAGGGQLAAFGETFVADQYFTGNGKSYTNIQASIAGTTEDALYQSERSTLQNQQSFGYSIPVTTGTYLVKLHFAEIYFGATGGGTGGVGSRVFSVKAEGNALPGLTNYDIIADVGSMTAVVKEVEVTVTDGALNLDFSASVNQPKVSAIEVIGLGTANQPPVASAGNNQTITLPTSSVQLQGTGSDPEDGANVLFAWNQVSGPAAATITSPNNAATSVTGLVAGTYVFQLTVSDTKGAQATSSVTVTVVPDAKGTTVARINAGGTAQTVNGVAWAGCPSGTNCNGYVTGGFAYTQSPLPTITGANYHNLNQSAYQTEWTGGQTGTGAVPVGATAFTYNIPVANGQYLVRLFFTELNKNGANLRKFDVKLEGVQKLTGFDVFAEANGMHKAIVREFPVNITDGNVNIDFIRQVENAKISAIEILPVHETVLNIAPVANAGADQLAAPGINGLAAVSLNGSASTDTDGYLVSYVWTNKEGNQLATGATPSVNLAVGAHEITLTVTDHAGAKSTSTTTVVVKTSGYALLVNTVGNGAVNPDGGVFAEGATVSLTATPQEGHKFIGWSGDASGTENPLSLTMNADKTVTATFAPLQFTVEATAGVGGTVSVTPAKANYTYNESISILATAATGYVFDSWSGGASGTANPLQMQVKDNVQVQANFKPVQQVPQQFKLTTTAGTGGTITRSPDQESYSSGTSVTLTAMPAPGYTFAGWSGSASGTTNPLIVSMDSDKTITASFVQEKYTVVLAPVTGGTASVSPSKSTYLYGDNVRFSATPAAGYEFVDWTINNVSHTDNPLKVPVTGNLTVKANFRLMRYTLTATAGVGGAVLKSPYQTSYESGSQVVLTAVPSDGYQFAGWSGDASGMLNPITVTMNSNKTITANFIAMVNSGTTVRVNAGGNEQTIDGVIWTGCQAINTCSSYVTGGNPVPVSNAIINGIPELMNSHIFQTAWTNSSTANVRKGTTAFTYNIPVPNGSYQVRLYFTDFENTTAGQRVFDVNIEGGKKELTSFDIIKEAKKANTVVMREIPMTVSDGNVTIDFIRQVGNPIVSAISVVPVGASTSLSATNGYQLTSKESKPLSDPGMQIKAYPNPNPGDKVNLELRNFGKEETVTITLYTTSGRVIQVETIETDEEGAVSKLLNLDKHLTRGVYVIRATSGAGSAHTKLVVE